MSSQFLSRDQKILTFGYTLGIAVGYLSHYVWSYYTGRSIRRVVNGVDDRLFIYKNNAYNCANSHRNNLCPIHGETHEILNENNKLEYFICTSVIPRGTMF